MILGGGQRSRGTKVAEREYMPQLDSLRFFAVLAVLIAHEGQPQKFPWILGALPWGALGVRLFFVLSGFLITGILLGCRDLAEATSQNPLFFIRQFYFRRFLRIFPIYYLVLVAIFAVNLHPAREIWVWLLTYTSNIYIALHRQWIGSIGHFWTLAVEEQFYIFWPWMVLFAPRKWLVPMISFAMVLAPVYRFYAVTHDPTDFAVGEFTRDAFTFACLDSLAIGALLALISQCISRREMIQKLLNRLILPIGIISYLVLFLMHYYKVNSTAFFIFGDLSGTLIFCWLVSAASLGFSGIVGKLLECDFIIYFGKITYGIYIYHNLVPVLFSFIFRSFGAEYYKPGLLNFILSSTVALLIASLSWHLVERPINSLKRYFKYAPSRTVQPIYKEIELVPSSHG
jgi:peptidoglycan/LPS O-acetylase OafA/YrhL